MTAQLQSPQPSISQALVELDPGCQAAEECRSGNHHAGPSGANESQLPGLAQGIGVDSQVRVNGSMVTCGLLLHDPKLFLQLIACIRLFAGAKPSGIDNLLFVVVCRAPS